MATVKLSGSAAPLVDDASDVPGWLAVMAGAGLGLGLCIGIGIGIGIVLLWLRSRSSGPPRVPTPA